MLNEPIVPGPCTHFAPFGKDGNATFRGFAWESPTPIGEVKPSRHTGSGGLPQAGPMVELLAHLAWPAQTTHFAPREE